MAYLLIYLLSYIYRRFSTLLHCQYCLRNRLLAYSLNDVDVINYCVALPRCRIQFNFELPRANYPRRL